MLLAHCTALDTFVVSNRDLASRINCGWVPLIFYTLPLQFIDAKHDAREAMKYHKEGLNVRKLNLGSNHVKVAASLDDIAGIYQKVGENERALKCLTESLRIRKLHLGSDSMEIATNLFGMGIVFAALSNNEKAMECYNASLDISACDGSNPKLEAQVRALTMPTFAATYC